MSYNLVELRARITSLRVLKEKTYIEMAEMAGISEDDYILFEKGKLDLPLSVIIELLNNLGYKLTISVLEEEF